MATTDEVVAEAAEGFFLAAEHGRSDVLKALADHAQGQLDLRQIVDPATGRTPLHVAVANGKTDAVRVLLAAGFPPDHESLPTGSKSNGFSASDASGKRQNTAYLLAKQLRASDLVFVFHQFTIQQIATNNADGVSQMLSAGVDVDTTDGSAQNTFVHWSVTCSAAQVLELLLQREDVQQAKVMDKLNTEGATPLHLACRTSNVECTRLLLRYGADRGVEGEKGVFKGKTAIEMATAQEVRELFTAHSDSKLSHQLQQSEPSGSQSTSSSLSSPPSSASTTAESAGEDDNAGAATTSRRNSRRASEQELQSARLLVQLEEKDLLIVQLRKTIETLVVESQEIRKLGDERVVLDYVRKLREENAILQRNLEDAEEHIRIQQEQLQQLKSEIRKAVTVQQDSAMESADTTAQDEHPHRHHHHHFQHTEGPADSSFPAAETQGSGTESARPPANPLRLDTTGGERVKPNWSERPPLSSSSSTDSTWGKSVLGGLWPFGSSDDVQDMDGEVIMTV